MIKFLSPMHKLWKEVKSESPRVWDHCKRGEGGIFSLSNYKKEVLQSLGLSFLNNTKV